jgi:nucleoside-diphosphate-sugar epimerase
MRLVVLGGTGFVGQAIVRALVENGHEVSVVHRGLMEPDTNPSARHIHGPRSAFAELWPQIDALSPEGLVDVVPYSRTDAEQVLKVIPDALRLVALSSMDVYRASGALHGFASRDAVPLDESAPLRDHRYIYRDAGNPDDDYEKLDVEEEYLGRGATILRLPMIYGEHDDTRREEFILRRCRARRKQIPIGPGSLLWSRGYVRDIAQAVRLALETEVAGEIFGVCESRTWSIGQWAREIALSADWRGEFVQVPEDALPPDMGLTGSFAQHLLFDSSRAQRVMGWKETDPVVALQASVDWHLAHPPDETEDFDADDRALADA